MNLKRRLFLRLFAITGAAIFANPLYALQQKLEAPKDVTELYLAMSRALPIGQSTNIAWSVTGERYVEYALGLYVDDAVKHGLDPEETLCGIAWRSFLVQLAKLDDYKNAKLYWRIKPEVAFFDGDVSAFSGFDSLNQRPVEKARIYLRYLISSKPALFTEDFLVSQWNYNNSWSPTGGR